MFNRQQHMIAARVLPQCQHETGLILDCVLRLEELAVHGFPNSNQSPL
ncbi:MAG: hypothetical protein ACJAX5_002667, partial [Patiriisocius sp.]